MRCAGRASRTAGRGVPLAATLLCAAGLLLAPGRAAADAPPPLPAGTLCQGPQNFQPAAAPTHVMHIVLENESAQDVNVSPDATFERGTLDTQCGTFGETNMKSTTHGSEGNYIAMTSGLNPAIATGADAVSRFTLSDCPPDSTSSSCGYGGGHIPATVPSLFSQVEQRFGSSGWKTYADAMPSPCAANDSTLYANAGGKNYYRYVVRHNPPPYFQGVACATRNVPSGNWSAGQGALHDDLAAGTLPPYSLVIPDEIENGHDPVSVNGVRVAGGTSQIGNIDAYLSAFLGQVQQSPQYQSGDLVLMVTFDEGFRCTAAGDCGVGENCADPGISAAMTSCDVKTWIVGRYVPSHTYTAYMNQFGLLAATERMLGLPVLGHAGDSAVPDIVAGTAAEPNPFGLAVPGSPPPAPTAPLAPTNLTATPGDGRVVLAWSRPGDGGSPISDYSVLFRPSGTTTWTTFDDGVQTTTGATVTGLTNGTPYEFAVAAVNAVGTGPPSAGATATPSATGPELLSDGGFEAGNGGWVPFNVGTFTRVTSPVHGGAQALRIAATGSGTALVGMMNTAVISNSVAGQPYTARCWVQPTGAGLNVLLRWLEYTQTYTGLTTLQTTTVATLPTGTWTLLTVTSAAVRSGERMIPQIYSTKETTATGSLVYDDCSITAGTGSAPPATVPGAPGGVSAVPGNAAATVSFTPPGSNGGSPVTGYTVTASPGGATGTGTGSPVTVGGLSNGTAYTFTVTATNGIGTGPPSNGSPAVTPSTVPGAPTGVTATAGEGSAQVSFTPPADTGGAPISQYTVTSSPAGGTATTTGSPVTVTGLVAGTSYTFTVTATNAAGTGPASDPSNAVVPTLPPPVPPGAPSTVVAVPGNGAATVSFSAPTSDGGSPITGYTVTSSPGGLTAGGTDSPLTVTGLTNGTAYTFTVAATNAIGTGPSSTPSAAVTPMTLPGAPTGVTAVAGVASAVVSFTPPTDTGGALISQYTVSSSPTGGTVTTTGSPATVTGLVAGISYTFTVTATNAAGTGAPSDPSNAVLPTLPPPVPPSAPSTVVAVPGNGAATVTFSPPASDGGSPVMGYTVTSSPGGATALGTGSPITVTGLTNGTAYTFTVTAANVAGTGLASLPSAAVTPTGPTTELLPDPGFESGNGGWAAFNVGAFTRPTSPVHGGTYALRIAATGSTTALVGMTQNSAVADSVAGRVYTASCWVRSTSGSLNVQIRILEYTQNFSSTRARQTTTLSSVPTTAWTKVTVSLAAAATGERMVPQIYSTNETTATGSLLYDDCSMTAG